MKHGFFKVKSLAQHADSGDPVPVRLCHRAFGQEESRPTPTGTGQGWVGAIENPSLVDDALVGASTPRARAVEIHRIIETAGLKSMQRLGSVVIEPANRFEFAPGGFHLMIIGLDAPLKEGDTLPVTLEFSRSGKIDVVFPVMTLVGGQ